MHRNDQSRFARVENGRRVTFVQPRVVRRIVRNSEPNNIQSKPNYYVECNRNSVPGYYERDNSRRDVRKMYRQVSPTQPKNYTENENTVTSRISNNNIRELYPRQRRVMRVVDDNDSFLYHRQDRISNANSNSLRFSDSDGTRRSYNRDVVPTTDRLIFVKPSYRYQTEQDDMTESDYSSDEESIRPRCKVKVVRVVPRSEIIPQQLRRPEGEINRERKFRPVIVRRMTFKDDSLPHGEHMRRSVPIRKSNSFSQQSTRPKMYAERKNDNADIMSSSLPIYTPERPKTTMIRPGRFPYQTASMSGVKRTANSYSTGNDDSSVLYDTDGSEDSTDSSDQSTVKNSDDSSDETLSEDSYTSSTSESGSTDTSQTSSVNKNISTRSNQTSRVLLDYSKMLQSIEERKQYEKERKQFEHETNVVTLVQKEVNKPAKRGARMSDKVTNNSQTNTKVVSDVADMSCECKNKSNQSSVDVGKSCSCQLLKSDPKPLPPKTKNEMDLEATMDIKESIRIEEVRRRKMEERSKLLAWTGREDFIGDNRVKRDSKSTVYNFDKCRQYNPEYVTDSDEPDNVEVRANQNEDFESLYPKPRPKGSQQVYYIDLTKPPEIKEPKPFDVETRRIVPQPKKTYDGPLVKVGGGWNTMDDYMTRHVPVKKFVYNREQQLPGIQQKYYGFSSHYKPPRSNLVYRPL